MSEVGRNPDVRELTGMASPLVRASAVPIFAATFGIVSVANRGYAGYSWQPALALVLLTTAAAVLVFAEGDPLGGVQTVVVVLAGPAAAGLCLVGLSPDSVNATTLWPLDAATLLYVYTCVRGRVAAAWAGHVLMALIFTSSWWTIGKPPSDPVLIAVNWLPMILATYLAVTIRSVTAAMTTLRERSSIGEARKAAAAAAAEERDAEVRRLGRLARPSLQRIASGTVLTPAERSECGLLEAQLRDGLRARALVVDPRVVAAVRTARQAGVEVVLLDDSSGRSGMAVLRAALLPHLTPASSGGRVTVRVLPSGRHAAMTVLVTDAVGEVARYEYDADGSVVVAAPAG